MDERYWWIVSRVQHSFNVRATEEAHIFAENLKKQANLSPIESFFSRYGSRRLFIYFSSTKKSVALEDITITNDPSDITEATSGSFFKILYFLRLDNSAEVSPVAYENEIYCGEINSSILENLNDFLNDIVLPCSKARQNWGLCTNDQKGQILSSLEKFTQAISEASSSSSKSSYQKILDVPPDAAAADFKATRQAAHDSELVQRFEEIVTSWIATIESTVLAGSASDAHNREAIVGPLAELDKWRRRNRILTALTEQLKSKECKNIIGALITAKSKVLKKWKAVDIAITDAVNDARDKLKYLDSLKKYLEDLYSPSITPGFIINQTIPSALITMKQMDSASRYYSRSGFMGLLFNQIANQLVLCFKDYLRALLLNGVDDDQLWMVTFREARSARAEDFADGSDRLIRAHFEQKLAQGRLHGKADIKEFDANAATLTGRIRACLLVQRLMRIALRHFRDSIGVGGHGGASASQASSQRAPSAGAATAGASGIAIQDDDAILKHLDAFSARLRQFLDVQASLSQMFRLVHTARKLPRPRKEDLEMDDLEAASAATTATSAATAAAAAASSAAAAAAAPAGGGHLEAIEEDNEQQSLSLEGDDHHQQQQQQSAQGTPHDAANDEELLRSIALMRKYYDSEGEGPSFSGVVKSFTDRATRRLQDSISTSSLLDVESKDKEKFTDVYRGFVDTLSELEQFASAYVHTIFQWKFYPQEALDILQALSPIGHRPAVKAALADKFVEIFGQFEEHLNDIRRLYEEGKTAPPRVRNSPPVAGAVNWSRQLLKQIEEPMKVFRDNPDVTSQLDYPRIVKMYNKVATALAAFEQLYLTQWRSQIEIAKTSLNATLFVRHPVTRELMVNLDEKVLELLQETKWLMRLGVKVPEGALAAMQLAPRIKQFAQRLREVLSQHRAALARIPANLVQLFRGHADKCFETFQPGLNNLAWNSTNIDGYLHQLDASVRALNAAVTEVNALLEAKVEGQLRQIGSMLMFDEEAVFSRSWEPDSFRSGFAASVQRRQLELQERTSVIAQGLAEIGQRLTVKQPLQPLSQQQQQQVLPTTAELVKSLSEYYIAELYQAVLSSTSRSLVTIAESTGVEDSQVLTSLSGLVRSRPQSRAASAAAARRPATVDSAAAADILTLDDYRRSKAQASAALTAVAKFSHPVWCDTDQVTYLRFCVALCYVVPKIVIQPELDSVQSALSAGVDQLFASIRGLSWPGRQGVGVAFCSQLLSDPTIVELNSRIGAVTQDLWSRIRKLIIELGVYDFLWKDNLPTNLGDFLASQPSNGMLSLEVDRLMAVEDRVNGLKPEYSFGCVQLQTQKAVDVLQGFVLTWKEAFASELHSRVRQELQDAVGYRTRQERELCHLEHQLNPELASGSDAGVGGGGVKGRVTLDDLNVALKLLEELRDMENKVDKIYLPIETMYARLQSYKLSLPRSEIEECHGLRDNWLRLTKLADQVRMQLLKDHRSHFEQELDKQVKNFVVEVIQFRNQFDAQGPFVPDIEPLDAVKRLHRFQEVYDLHSRKRQTLDSVSKLFGIVTRQFDELDRTGEELVLLNLLYDLFQKFIRFEENFRQELWEDVDLDRTVSEVEGYWDESLALPSKLRGWAAHLDMKARMQRYRMMLPLLKKLKSKEIRSRHWTQVMQITGVNFSLERETFRLKNLLDIGLLEHAEAVEEVCRAAQKEQELELKMKQIEEEWTEQVLSFLPYKRKGNVLLDKAVTERLLEQLEHSQTELAVMLTSRHIEPLRDEAASWAEKLKDIFHVLELWAEVQELWQDLEAVFCVPETARELPQEAKRFESVDRSYVKSMKRAFATKNVLQCCIGGGDVPKSVVLRHMHEELEICFKSLVAYLDNKRRIFPRLSFVSNSILLSILRRPHDLETVRPQLRSLFSAVSDVHTERVIVESVANGGGGGAAKAVDQVSTASSARGGRRTPAKAGGPSVTLVEPPGATSADRERDEESQQHLVEDASTEKVIYDICGVISPDGDELMLNKKVTLDSNVEVWLSELQRNIGETLAHLSQGVIADINALGPLDELAFKYPSQVCRLGLIYYWTKECEFAIGDIRNDRKALQNVTKKFSATMTRLPTILHRGAWKTLDDKMLPVHRRRLSNMITEAYYLRECLETMITRKVKDGVDFDWRRNVRCYARDVNEQQIPSLYIQDLEFSVGPEFMGSASVLAPTPMTDRCFLAMSQALKSLSGCLVQGPSGCGKTETVKGLAQLLGRHVCVTHARSSFDAQALSKLVQGVVADGCWSLIDEVQKLPAEATGVLVDHVRSVFHSLASGLNTCHLGDSHEVSIGSSVGFLITYNPFNHAGQLPCEIRAYYRPVSISRPDLLQVLKMKCLAMGFRAPTLLATRLKLMSEYAADQLPNEPQNTFGLNSLCAVLARADQLRQIANEEAVNRQDSTLGQPGAGAATQQQQQQQQQAQQQQQQQQLTSSEFWPPFKERTEIITNRATGQKLPTFVNKKTASNLPLSAAAKQEHSMARQAALELLEPRVRPQSVSILRQAVADVFGGLPPVSSSAVARKTADILDRIGRVCQARRLSPAKAWLEKCIQIFNVSGAHTGVVLAGPPGCGKSTALEVLVAALAALGGGAAEETHRLQRIFPLSVDSLSAVFGELKANGEWSDGVFTSAFRKANRNQSTTWLQLDAPLNTSWSDNFNSVLDAEATLHLRNGDQLKISDRVRIVFETDSLADASPAALGRSGIVHFDVESLGWRPVANAWLRSRTPQVAHTLNAAFEKTLDSLIPWVQTEVKPIIPGCSLVGVFQSCLGLLQAMLDESAGHLSGTVHVERLYLFALVWSFGALLVDNDRVLFSKKLKDLSSALPDDDREICIYDYYVDESGEWDPWTSRVPELINTDDLALSGQALVETVDTIRVQQLLDLSYKAQRSVLLVGPRGGGKTLLGRQFAERQDSQLRLLRQLVYSGDTEAATLQRFVQANTVHRQGFVYGAKEGKRLLLCIEDVSAPRPDSFGIQRPGELLRQLCDCHQLVTQERPHEWRQIEGLSVVASAATGGAPAVPTPSLSPRLLRHFNLVHVPAPAKDALRSVVRGVLESQMNFDDRQPLEQDALASLMEASCQLLESCQATLKLSPLPGRRHYLFNLKDLCDAFLCLRRLPDERRIELTDLVPYWVYQVRRGFADRVCRTADALWFNETLEQLCAKHFPSISVDLLSQQFATFDKNVQSFNIRPTSSFNRASICVSSLMPKIESFDELRETLDIYKTRYNEEEKHEPLEVTLSETVIAHIVRVHRALSVPYRGHVMLIGSIGTKLSTLCRLAAFMLEMRVQEADTRSRNAFFDSLRGALRLAGLDAVHVAVIVTARCMMDSVYWDAINSIIACGEHPQLFTNEEMDTLMQSLVPTIKKENQALLNDPVKFYLSRVRQYLHFVICLPPSDPLLCAAVTSYPCLLKHSQVNWVNDWSMQTLLQEAQHFFGANQQLNLSKEDADALGRAFAQAHSLVLREFRQVPWAGDQELEVELTKYKESRSHSKQETLRVPNRPYAQKVLLDHLRSRHIRSGEDAACIDAVPIGPMHFRRLLLAFHYLYSSKTGERRNRLTLLRRALATLAQSRHDERTIRAARAAKLRNYQEVRAEADRMLAELTKKVTVLEKIRSRTDHNSSLTHFLKMNDLPPEETEQDELLNNEDYDDYDRQFEQIRQETMKNRKTQARDELAAAKETYRACKASLESARKEVASWSNKVDRNCIERIRAFQNPPALVGQVMEMVCVLIGKKPPTLTAGGTGAAGGDKRKDADGLLGDRTSLGSAQPKPTGRGQKEEKVDRAAWKQMQQSMNDSVKFVEMLQNVSWLDGLDKDVLRTVESYLAKSKDGQLGVTGEGSLLEGADNIEKIRGRRDQSPGDGGPRGITISQAKYSSEDAATLVHYTIALVEYSRLCGPLKDAKDKIGTLEREIVESERSERDDNEKANAAAADAASAADAEAAAADAAAATEDADTVEKDLKRLQKEYNDVILNKHRLQGEIDSMDERLRRCLAVLRQLQPMEAEWSAFVTEFSSDAVLQANCAVAAAFVTYCGGLSADARRRLAGKFRQLCEAAGVPAGRTKSLFDPLAGKQSVELADFLFKSVDTDELELLRLPTTRLQRENACFVMLERHCQAWPLICDPTRAAVTWLRKYQQSAVEVKYHSLRTQLEAALADGSVLVVTDCDLDQLADDRRFRPVLMLQRKFLTETAPFKMLLLDHEVECSPNFRLYLHTSALPSGVPQHLAAYTNLLSFHRSRQCTEELLLDRFLELEKPRVEREWRAVLADRLRNRKSLEAIKEAVAEHLATEGARLMNDLPLAGRLHDLAKQMEETESALERLAESEALMRKSRESHRDIARRGAVCFEVTGLMRCLSPMYSFSFQELIKIYDLSIQHSDRPLLVKEYKTTEPTPIAFRFAGRIAVQTILERLTWSAYLYTCRALLEADRCVYRTALAMEISDSLGHVQTGEREFVISPSFGAEVVRAADAARSPEEVASAAATAATVAAAAGASSGANAPGGGNLASKRRAGAGAGGDTGGGSGGGAGEVKKPDWMTDEAFGNLSLLAQSFPWFAELFGRLNSSESQWRGLVENSDPESAPLPDKAEEHLKPLQRLCIIRSVRPERLLQATSAFVSKVLGARYAGDPGIEPMAVGSDPATPVLLLHDRDASAADRLVRRTAAKVTGRPAVVFQVADDSSQTERGAKRAIQRADADGAWVLLHFSGPTTLDVMQRCADLVAGLQRQSQQLLSQQQQQQPQASSFRLLMTCRADCCLGNHRPPVLQSAVKIYVDMPTIFKDCVQRCWSAIEQQDYQQFPQQQQQPASSTMPAMRASAGGAGGGRSDWPAALHNLTMLHAALQLRARLGGGFNRPGDAGHIGLEDFLAASRALAREFRDEATGKMVAGRAVNYVSVRSVLQETVYGGAMLDWQDALTVGAAADYWLSANSVRKDFEVAKLKYRIPAVFFGSQSSKLPVLIQALEQAIPAFSFDSAEGCHLQPSEETSLGLDHYVFTRLNLVLDRLPASPSLSHDLYSRPPTPTDGPSQCQVGPNSLKPTVAARGAVASGSRGRKLADLMEVCNTALAKLGQPRTAPVAETLSKAQQQQQPHPQQPAFAAWMMREFQLTQVLVSAVRDSLQNIKNALLDSSSLGDCLSPEDTEAADDLHRFRLPARWSRLWGRGAPPPHHPLASFLTDLTARQSQIDRALALGRARMPLYNLGLLAQPNTLLSLLLQEAAGRSPEPSLLLVAELSSRDRDHIRDPPTEGIFVHGLCLWNGCLEKGSWELLDSPPKAAGGYTPMPVIQLTCVTQEARALAADPAKQGEVYACPVYFSRHQPTSATSATIANDLPQSPPQTPMFEVELRRDGVSSMKWALRGVQATLRPY